MNNKRRMALAKLQTEALDIDTDDVELGHDDYKAKAQEIKAKVDEVCAEEQEAYDNLLPSLQDGERGEAMKACIEAMESASNALDSINDLNPDNEPDWRDSIGGALEDFDSSIEEAQA